MLVVGLERYDASPHGLELLKKAPVFVVDVSK
jgi:hypothetical protein